MSHDRVKRPGGCCSQVRRFKGYCWQLVLGVHGLGDDTRYGLYIKPTTTMDSTKVLCQAQGIKLQVMSAAQPGQVARETVLPMGAVSAGHCEGNLCFGPRLRQVWGDADFFGIRGDVDRQAWRDAGLVHHDGKVHVVAVVEEVLQPSVAVGSWHMSCAARPGWVMQCSACALEVIAVLRRFDRLNSQRLDSSVHAFYVADLPCVGMIALSTV